MPPNYPPGTNSLPPGGTLIIDQTPIIGGTDGLFLYDNNGVVGETAGGGGGTITEGVTPTSGFTPGFAITDNSGVVGQAQIRTILTGNLNLYVDPLGSDSYNGLSATFTGGVNGPLATVQRAFTVIGTLYDGAGFQATINVAAGTLAGGSYVPALGFTGITVLGAGSTLTTLTDGPNDGTINVGENIGVNFPGAAVSVQGFSLEITDRTLDITNIFMGTPGSSLTLADDINFVSVNNGQAGCIEISGLSNLFANPGNFTITMNGTTTAGGAILLQEGAQMFDTGNWTTTGTADDYYGAFIVVQNSAYFEAGATYTATTPPNGLRFISDFGGRIGSNAGPGTMGLGFFPGTTPGTCDASSSYDGSPGPIPGWSPLLLSGLIAFWRADLGVTQVAGVVSDWTDQSINGFTLSQSNAPNRPAYSATGFGGLTPGITFAEASPSFLSTAAFAFNSTKMSVAVLLTMTSNTQANSGVVSFQAPGQANDFTTPSWLVSTAAADNLLLYSSGSQGNGGSQLVVPATMPTLAEWIFNGVNANAVQNGNVMGTPTAFTSTLGGAGTGTLAFGTRPWNGDTPSFDGTLAFVIISDLPFSGSDLANIKAWANANWGTLF